MNERERACRHLQYLRRTVLVKARESFGHGPNTEYTERTPSKQASSFKVFGIFQNRMSSRQRLFDWSKESRRRIPLHKILSRWQKETNANYRIASVCRSSLLNRLVIHFGNLWIVVPPRDDVVRNKNNRRLSPYFIMVCIGCVSEFSFYRRR